MDAAVAVKNALEEERQREMMDKYFSSYKINPIDSLWNEEHSPIETPRPSLLPGSVRVDHNCPGKWVWSQVTAKGEEQIKIAKLFYTRDERKQIIRTDANRGTVSETFNEKMVLTENEAKILFRYLGRYFTTRGLTPQEVLAVPIVDY